MAGLPQNFAAISNVLPTYDFVDIIAGTGYVNFYAGNTVDKKCLSNFEFYSDDMYTATDANHAGFTLIYDADYDVVLNRPLDIYGLGIVNVPIHLTTSAGITEGYVIAILRKWDGVTETDIATNQSDTYTTVATSYRMVALDLTIALTHFKKGETLRLTINTYGKTNAHVGAVDVGNDPKNRSAGWDTTGAVPSQLSFQCPVRLNL